MAINSYWDKSPDWRERWSLFNYFSLSVTSSKSFFLAWAKKGWSIRYHYGRSLPFGNDHSVILEAIKTDANAPTCTRVGQLFSALPSSLRDNKVFMLSAVEANPEVIRFASENLLDDFDFLLRAISVSRATLAHFCHRGKDFDLLADFAAEAKETLAHTDGVVLQFFGAMSIDPCPTGSKKRAKRRRTGRTSDNCCHLRLLDLGGEGGMFIKRTIAEFAGISVGPYLKLLRSALENLEYWGY
jgi:hypothetical protein